MLLKKHKKRKKKLVILLNYNFHSFSHLSIKGEKFIFKTPKIVQEKNFTLIIFFMKMFKNISE